MRPTVHDLAKAAGVSLATVDRVLNRRSGVRDETRRKVDEAVSAIGYVRDVAAATLPRVAITPSPSSFLTATIPSCRCCGPKFMRRFCAAWLSVRGSA